MDRNAMMNTLKALAQGSNMSLTALANMVEQVAHHDETVPTVSEFAPRVEAVEAGESDWDDIAGDIDRLVEQFGDERLDQISPNDIKAFANRLGSQPASSTDGAARSPQRNISCVSLELSRS